MGEDMVDESVNECERPQDALRRYRIEDARQRVLRDEEAETIARRRAAITAISHDMQMDEVALYGRHVKAMEDIAVELNNIVHLMMRNA